MQIYHNPRCSKSRQTLALIREGGVEPEIIEYLTNPPPVVELTRILDLLGMAPETIVRKGEEVYKDLGLKDKKLSREEWIQVLVDHPKLIERPIVVAGENAVLGRPPENVAKLL